MDPACGCEGARYGAMEPQANSAEPQLNPLASGHSRDDSVGREVIAKQMLAQAEE